MILNLAHPQKSDIKYEIINFPDGHKHLKILSELKFSKEKINIKTRLRNFDELFILAQAIQILAPYGIDEVFISYLLAARCDRKFSHGEAFDLKIVCDFLNRSADGLPIRFHIFDAHSYMSRKLIDKPCEYVQCSNIEFDPNLKIKCVAVLPDEGAENRFCYPQCVKFTQRVRCAKERNPHTGELISFKIKHGNEFVQGSDCVVLDDLCDGGGTFIGIAQLLKEAGAKDLYLVVTHGIFSKGFDELKKYYKHIYTTNSFQDFESNEFMTVTEVI